MAEPLTYPRTRTVDQVDIYHGIEVADPYRWLENDVRTDDEVADWVRRQNEVTDAYLRALPGRDRIRSRLLRLWDYERRSAPSKVADYYVFSRNDGLQNQSVLYLQQALDTEPELLLDPNEWSADGTVALAGTSFSEDGRYMAFAKSTGGSDWREWYVMEVDSRRTLPDHLRWIKWGSVSWTHDGRGFFYSRFPEVEGEAEYQSLNRNSSLWYHRLGTPQAEDVLVYRTPEHPDWNLHGGVTEDGRYLLIYISIGTDDRNQLLVKDLHEPYGMPVGLFGDFENEWSVIGNDGTWFYLKTDHEAARGRVVRVDLRVGRESMLEVVPEAAAPLRGAGITGNLIVCSYLRDVLPLVRMFHLDGSHVRDVEFPGIGSGGGFGGRWKQTETFYSYSSFDTPPSIFRYDMITGASQLHWRAEVQVDPERYEVKQVFYTSKDGTRIPMFLTHRKGLELDGRTPVLVYGYGGFNASMTPGFSVTRLVWLEMGGVFAMPNIRGGGEYGQAWHKAGTKLQKQNVFDDFIAAGEWLIAEGYTSPDKLAIQGGSNGGLLVGACMVQRPELFKAALPAVGVMDMLRFHQFTAGRYWTDDYGSVEDPEEFRVLNGYSPYHNLKPGVAYPATLVTTADTDDRVVPGHSFKFAARLQACHAGAEPVLIRIETDAGHGAGKPTEKVIELYADQWAFLADRLGMTVPREWGEE
ncbi:MAG TPA: S9 family peptidase [Verrucomicrobia bacterium]|nr:S9 family peptidase [Verrucomicrobiota bacterium]